MASQRLILEYTSRFQGGYPDVPFAPGITKDAVAEGDSDPFFVTLPIGKVDAVSKNGRHYPRRAIQKIVDAINERQVGGNKGHLSEEQLATKYDLPVFVWVGAILDEQGTAWGKAYVPQYAQDVREYIRMRMRTKANIATSVQGNGVVDSKGTVTELEIMTIDLADPERAGVGAAVAIPRVTAEMDDPPQESETEQSLMTENLQTLLTERDRLRSDLDAANARIAELSGDAERVKAISKLFDTLDIEGKAASLMSEHTDAVKLLANFDVLSGIKELIEAQAELVKVLGKNPIEGAQALQQKVSEMHEKMGDNPIEAFTALQEQVETYRQRTETFLTDAVAGTVAKSGLVESAHPLLSQMVLAEMRVNPEQEIETAFQAVLGRDEIKQIVGEKVVEQHGPAHAPKIGNVDNKDNGYKHIVIPAKPSK